LISADNAGCWIDGHWGHYSGARLIQIAEAYRWNDEMAISMAQSYMGSGGDIPNGALVEFYDLVDEAENYLNTIAPEGYSFGWRDGEFFLLSNEEWEDG
jgi:hypothetical protein